MKKFTIIELLIIIAIIGVLASLLLPTLGKARKVSQRTVCLNSIKNVNTGLMMFSDDNAEMIAKNHGSGNSDRFAKMDWPYGIDPYLGGKADISTVGWNLFRRYSSEAFYGCPTTNEDSLNTNAVYSSDYGIPVNSVYKTKSYVGYKRTTIEKPAESVLLADAYVIDESGAGRSSFRISHYDKVTGFTTDFKHVQSTSTYAFFDGHVESIRWLPKEVFIDKYMYDSFQLKDIGLTPSDVTP